MPIFPDAVFLPLEIRRSVTSLLQRFSTWYDAETAPPPPATMASSAVVFLTTCFMCGADPIKTLEQLDRLIKSDAFSLADDPAHGQYVHPPGHA